ncbi:MAG: hypothetical protein GY940_20080 [bacterium]|nr:hypothetical protein [bacterium]
MEKSIKSLCLKYVMTGILLTGCLVPRLQGAEENLRFKGDYFLFSDDMNYIYGSGNIQMKHRDVIIDGNTLYMDVKKLSGMIYKGTGAVFFKAFPLKQMTVTYGDAMIIGGDKTLKPLFETFIKNAPELLKKASLYFEFREFRINKNQKIKAKIVVPYMMGLPTVPLKRFTVNRGEWAEKTMLSFRNLNYSELDGLSLSFFLRMREKQVKGDYDLKLYERRLFKLDGPKRGILVSGKSGFFYNKKKKELLTISTLLNSGEESFNLTFNHKVDSSWFRYSLAQTVSGRKDLPVFLEFRSDVSIKKLKLVEPRFNFTHNLEKSYSYKLSTPLRLVKKLNLNVGWQRKIIKDRYRSDTSDISTSLSFNHSLFLLSSNYNYSRNLLEATVRKNFAVNLKLKPLWFLEKNVAIDVSSFYLFSSLPFGQETRTRISPGVTLGLRSFGAAMPLGFKLVPKFALNHLWDNREENFTDFNTGIALQKEIGNFGTSIEYALTSRYRAENFWVEGNNRQNLHLNFFFKDNDRKNYSFLLRFYHNNDLALENISFTGQVNLPFDLNFSSFLLYYNNERKFQTLEIFIQKTFKRTLKIQGGYSLALKRFFIKFLTQ